SSHKVASFVFATESALHMKAPIMTDQAGVVPKTGATLSALQWSKVGMHLQSVISKFVSVKCGKTKQRLDYLKLAKASKCTYEVRKACPHSATRHRKGKI